MCVHLCVRQRQIPSYQSSLETAKYCKLLVCNQLHTSSLRPQAGVLISFADTTGGELETRAGLVYICFSLDFAAKPHYSHLMTYVLCQHFISIFITALDSEIASQWQPRRKVFLLKIQLLLLVIILCENIRVLVRRVNQFENRERP